MTDLPDLKFKALVNFPTNAIGGTGIDVEKINGNFVVDLAYDDFAPPVGGVSDPAHQNALLWNSVTDVYTLAPISLIGSGGSVPEAPNDGAQYGRQSLGWTPVVGGTGPKGDKGDPGAPGAPGVDGNTVLYGTADPVAGTGVNGNFYINTTTHFLFGPKAGGAWPAGTSLVGPMGPQGLPGTGGSGSGNVTGPTSAVSGNIATYNGTTGTLIQDGGQSIASLIVPPATVAPVIDGTATIGSVARYAREDHIHPTDTSRAALTQVVRYDTAQALTTTQQKQSRSNIGANDANVIINGDFRINQVVYVSAAALAAGVYGHDQWKAGASGGDYSFTQLKSSTQITIASGKSLIQPIEDANVVGGSYVLTWIGTAQARAGINTLTPSGSYAASPLLITGQTAGTAMSIEFNTGTLGAVKLESGATATPFIMRPLDQELLTCQRYYQKSYGYTVSPGTAVALSFSAVGLQLAGSAVGSYIYLGSNFMLPVRMRSNPSVTVYDTAGAFNKISVRINGTWTAGQSGIVTIVNEDCMGVIANGITNCDGITYHYVADARL